MRLKKPKFWNSINFLSICLWPLSLITVIFNILKTHIITGFRFNIPVICVGNVFIGGTGKTPLSIYIYNLLKKRRFKPAIVRKYYKSHLDEIKVIDFDHSDVVRHPLVSKIVKAYSSDNDQS